jgi:predicted transcriptional regulator
MLLALNTTIVVLKSLMSPRNKELGPLEMEVLGILDQKCALSVSEIQRILKQRNHDLAYTTVMTVLVRLHHKKLVHRQKEGRQFLYLPAKSAAALSESLLSRMSRTLFRNQRLSPILALLEDESDLSQEELMELRKAIDQKIKQSGREV